MGIAEFLDAPDGAVLVAINGEVELVTTRHETATRLTIERFPLGPVASVDAVMALLDLNSVRPPPIAAPVARPALAAPEDRRYACPECRQAFKRNSHLVKHCKTQHGLKVTGDIVCPICGLGFQSARGLQIHQGQKHKGAQVAEATPLVTSAAIPPGPPLVAAMPSDPRGTCNVCGMPNRNHLACEECARRIGPGHTVEAPARQHRGKVWCESCVEVLRQETAHNGKAARV